MKYCSHCGGKIDGEPRFCEHCGGALAAEKSPGSVPVAADAASRVKAGGPRSMPLVVAVVVVALLALGAVGWVVFGSGTRSDIPDAAALLGMDEAGVQKALGDAEALEGASDGALIMMVPDAAEEVVYALADLDTMGRRPEAKAAYAAQADALGQAGIEASRFEHDALVTVAFDDNGVCVAVELRLSGMAAREALGEDVELEGVAHSGGLGKDAKAVDIPAALEWVADFGGDTFCATFGDGLALVSYWTPLTDEMFEPVDADKDAGDLSLMFGPASLVDPEWNPFAQEQQTETSSEANGDHVAVVPDFVAMYYDLWANYTDGPLPEQTIARYIQAEGFTPVVFEVDSYDTYQEPEAGSKVPIGSELTLYIGVMGD